MTLGCNGPAIECRAGTKIIGWWKRRRLIGGSLKDHLALELERPSSQLVIEWRQHMPVERAAAGHPLSLIPQVK